MIRQITLFDIYKWAKLIKQLSPQSVVREMDLYRLFRDNKEIWVYEKEGEIVGTLSMLYEQKPNRELGLIVHIEEVVVDIDFRGQGIAGLLLDFAVKRAKEKRAYKVILNCKEDLVALYEKAGFSRVGVSMAQYL